MSYRLLLPNTRSARPVVESLVTRMAEVGGLTEDEAFLLGQACGEVHDFLCSGPEEMELEWVCRGLPSYAEAQLWLPARPRTWQALQACQLSGLLRDFSRERLLPAANLQPGQTGLMRAARAVEQVHLRAEDRRVGLVLRKEHRYPDLENRETPPIPPQVADRIGPPGPAGLQDFCSQLAAAAPASRHFLRHPQRVADLMSSDGLEGALAYGAQERCLGGMFWRIGERVVEGFGPYLMPGQPGQVAEQLVDHCLRAVARTKAQGLSITESTSHLPVHQFERLGAYRLHSQELSVYFRQLHEDPGGVVWSPPGLEDWLRRQFDRLELAREIRSLDGAALPSNPFSAFSTQFHGDERSRLILRPIHPGQDVAENLSRYLNAALEAKLDGVFLAADLGVPWQAALGETLSQLNFQPCLIRPLGGDNIDQLVWQYADA